MKLSVPAYYGLGRSYSVNRATKSLMVVDGNEQQHANLLTLSSQVVQSGGKNIELAVIRRNQSLKVHTLIAHNQLIDLFSGWMYFVIITNSLFCTSFSAFGV